MAAATESDGAIGISCPAAVADLHAHSNGNNCSSNNNCNNSNKSSNNCYNNKMQQGDKKRYSISHRIYQHLHATPHAYFAVRFSFAPLFLLSFSFLPLLLLLLCFCFLCSPFQRGLASFCRSFSRRITARKAAKCRCCGSHHFYSLFFPLLPLFFSIFSPLYSGAHRGIFIIFCSVALQRFFNSKKEKKMHKMCMQWK